MCRTFLCYSPITYLTRACGPQVVCLIQCDGWACFPVHSLANHSVIDEMATHRSFSTINHNWYFVFRKAEAESPVLHKYVATKVGKTLLLCLINLDSHLLQAIELRKFIYIRHIFQGTITGYAYELLLFTSS
jgi:hypothetical protein